MRRNIITRYYYNVNIKLYNYRYIESSYYTISFFLKKKLLILIKAKTIINHVIIFSIY